MMPIATTEELQEFVDYKFKYPEILEEARTRNAYKNENPCRTKECMDPLATLGDAILDTIAVYRIYEEGERRKGKLTENKILNIKRKKTRTFAEKMKLGKYIRWGKGEDQDEVWNKGDRALDTVTEALIGAIFLDAQKSGENGLKIVQNFLETKNFFDMDPE
jgi:ribonuclease-3